MRTVCNELGDIEHKAYKIGIQIGISRSKLLEFEKEDLLSAAIDYWLCGNVPDVPVTWGSIVQALESKHVNETGCANRIKAKYCDPKNKKG